MKKESHVINNQLEGDYTTAQWINKIIDNDKMNWSGPVFNINNKNGQTHEGLTRKLYGAQRHNWEENNNELLKLLDMKC